MKRSLLHQTRRISASSWVLTAALLLLLSCCDAFLPNNNNVPLVLPSRRLTSFSALHATTTKTKNARTAAPRKNKQSKSKKSSSSYGTLPKMVMEMMDHELLTRQQDLEYGSYIQKARKVQKQIDDLYDMQQLELSQQEEEQEMIRMLRVQEDELDDDLDTDGYIDFESLYAAPSSSSSASLHNNNNNPDEIEFDDDLHNLSVYATSSASQILPDELFSGEEDDDFPLFMKNNFDDEEDDGGSDYYYTALEQSRHTDNRLWLQRRRQYKKNTIVGSAKSSPDINFLNTLDRLQSLSSVTTKNIAAGSVIDKPEELQRLLLQGAMAKNELIRCNIKLVVSIAKKWEQLSRSKKTTPNFVRSPMAELIQEGIVGLALAADRYDASKQLRFSTYATWYITNEIRNCVRASPLRIPPYYSDITNKYKALLKEQYEEMGDDAAAHAGVGGSADNMSEMANRLGISLKVLQRALRYTQPLLSLDSPIVFDSQTAEDSGMSYLDNVVEDDESLQPEKVVERSLLRQALEDAMAVELLPFERDVVRLRLGLDDGVQRTYSDVATVLGTTLYDVRGTERRAFRKLTSTPLYTPVLVSFLPQSETMSKAAAKLVKEVMTTTANMNVNSSSSSRSRKQ